eukprot:2523849-Rhodomonas_salina.5
MCGTELAYGATRYAVLNIAYGSGSCIALPPPPTQQVPYLPTRVLRHVRYRQSVCYYTPYAVCGTGLCYAIRGVVLLYAATQALCGVRRPRSLLGP